MHTNDSNKVYIDTPLPAPCMCQVFNENMLRPLLEGEILKRESGYWVIGIQILIITTLMNGLLKKGEVTLQKHCYYIRDGT